MQNDKSALFRDKAAYALASDQIHLNGKQKIRLYERLIKSLENPKARIRELAIKALKIQTGQDMGFNPRAMDSVRGIKVEEWKKWIRKYRLKI